MSGPQLAQLRENLREPYGLADRDYIVAYVAGWLESYLDGKLASKRLESDFVDLEELKAELDEVFTAAVRPLVRTTAQAFTAIDSRLAKLEQIIETEAASRQVQHQQLGLLLELAERPAPTCTNGASRAKR